MTKHSRATHGRLVATDTLPTHHSRAISLHLVPSAFSPFHPTFSVGKHVHVHHINASYENSSVISERPISTAHSVGHHLDVLGQFHVAADSAVTVARNAQVLFSLFGERPCSP